MRGKYHWKVFYQEPKLEVPTIYKAYVRDYPSKIWPYMVQYLHFRILEFPLISIPPTRIFFITTLQKNDWDMTWGKKTHSDTFSYVFQYVANELI